jgi:hypothetical protein
VRSRCGGLSDGGPEFGSPGNRSLLPTDGDPASLKFGEPITAMFILVDGTKGVHARWDCRWTRGPP